MLQEVDITCSISWLSKLVKVALVPPEKSKTSENMTNLKDQTPYWELEDLKTALSKASVPNVCLFLIPLSDNPVLQL